jgi:uncharacterized repeat protein (TIGR03803 family)
MSPKNSTFPSEATHGRINRATYLGILEGDSLDMNRSALSLIVRSIAVILPLTFSVVSAAAQGVTVIADFAQTPTDAFAPSSPLVFDEAGNLYGVVISSGVANSGSVFELTEKPDGVWARRDLYNFTGGADGRSPGGPLVLDAAGNVYGATEGGGDNYQGTVFELSPSRNGSWTETVLHSFGGYFDGELPQGGVIFDGAGNLYGATSAGGVYGYGSIFQLTPGRRQLEGIRDL